MIPIKPRHRKSTPFYWWRRYRTHKSLPYKATLLNKIRNGDFEYPSYFEQAKWELAWMKDEQQEFLDSYHGKNHMEDHLYLDIEKRARKRYNKLFEDGMKTEHERMEDLKTKLAKEFKIGVKGIKVVMEEFGGTTEELYFHVAKSQGINTDTLNKLNEFKR
jgi:hypothetical protein|tara:strand:- start:1102 stop:1584 length:483 start_codon:yes stop_codon:yes gene_type:complete